MTHAARMIKLLQWAHHYCYDFEDIILVQTDNLNSWSEKLRKILKNRSGLEY